MAQHGTLKQAAERLLESVDAGDDRKMIDHHLNVLKGAVRQSQHRSTDVPFGPDIPVEYWTSNGPVRK